MLRAIYCGKYIPPESDSEFEDPEELAEEYQIEDDLQELNCYTISYADKDMETWATFIIGASGNSKDMIAKFIANECDYESHHKDIIKLELAGSLLHIIYKVSELTYF